MYSRTKILSTSHAASYLQQHINNSLNCNVPQKDSLFWTPVCTVAHCFYMQQKLNYTWSVWRAGNKHHKNYYRLFNCWVSARINFNFNHSTSANQQHHPMTHTNNKFFCANFAYSHNTLLSVMYRLIHTGWVKKTWHFTFVHIFANYWPIFKILSQAHSADNLQ